MTPDPRLGTLLSPSLFSLGYDDRWAEAIACVDADGCVAGRVVCVERGRVRVLGEGVDVWASVAGRLHHKLASDELPATGDWVAVRPDSARVEAVLPRRTVLARRAVGDAGARQVVAANLDRVAVVSAIGADWSPPRIARYVAAVRAGGAEPLVVVNKCDLPYDPVKLIVELDEAAPGVDAAFVSAHSAWSELERFLVPGETLAFVGSSGVGKSTLTNCVLGAEVQATQEAREGDDKGRHTTTRRELIVAPSGVLVIDTPGMREFGIVDAEDGVSEAFADVEALAASCRFGDCSHQGEPGCALDAALEAGELSEERWVAYEKLQREAAYARRRVDAKAARDEAKRWKALSKSMRVRGKVERKNGLKGW